MRRSTILSHGNPAIETEQEGRIVTTKIAVAVLGVLLIHTPALADTGFLDRTITVGTVSYRYQVYVPANHTPAKVWPVIVDLHGNGSQGTDGLLPTLRGLADQIRLD